ncbi:hypothetical protein CTI12_AA110730 [Artemisia annua]|uniref:Uncharacterized protein n=1 Tax=Artemisia annua TaxID=35608 RepID=A0A2U1PRW9_ARTAN|nr:hypothetical protein CTI12_AA110730 [Artemisia annua]
MYYFAVYFILSSSSSDSISLFYDSSNSESSSDDNLTQILQRCEFQKYDSTTSENLNYDDPQISDEVIEVVPLQIILPTEPAPANNPGLPLPVPFDQRIPITPAKKPSEKRLHCLSGKEDNEPLYADC